MSHLTGLVFLLAHLKPTHGFSRMTHGPSPLLVLQRQTPLLHSEKTLVLKEREGSISSYRASLRGDTQVNAMATCKC